MAKWRINRVERCGGQLFVWYRVKWEGEMPCPQPMAIMRVPPPSRVMNKEETRASFVGKGWDELRAWMEMRRRLIEAYGEENEIKEQTDENQTRTLHDS